jgi:hypothetical protein
MEFATLLHLLRNPPEVVGSLWGESLLPKKGLTLLHSSSKMGKSMLSVNLALAGARGLPTFLGQPLHGPFTTLILQSEIHLRGVYDRVDTMVKYLMATQDGITEEHLSRIYINLERTSRLSDDATFLEFQQLVRVLKPDFLILDPLAHVLTSSENDNAIVGAMLERLGLLRDDPGCAIMLIHHDSKPTEGTSMRSPRQRARGADRLNADPDCILSLEPGARLATGPSGKLHVASRYGKSVPPFSIRLNEENLWFEQHIERGDPAAIAIWVAQFPNAQCSELELIMKIEEEWGLHDPKQHRAAHKYIDTALEFNFIVQVVVGDAVHFQLKKEHTP